MERRTIRRFTNREIEQEKIALLHEILLRSPSGKNSRPWEFIFVDNPDLICALKKCRATGTKALETAPLAVAVCADEKITDTWVEDCSIAAILLQVAAGAIGLGSCWIQIRNRFSSENKSTEEIVHELLRIPLNIRVLCLITIGYPDETKEPKQTSDLDFGKIRRNTY